MKSGAGTPRTVPDNGISRRARLRSRLGLAIIGLLGVGLMLYPMTAAWFSQLAQSALVEVYGQEIDELGEAARLQELEKARRYNQRLRNGAAFDPFTRGVATVDSPQYKEYLNTLSGIPSGVMGRIRIKKIDVDLPIYHGTSESVLDIGVGHLYGTALPVEGDSSHSVMTAHSGLAKAILFTDLSKLDMGDTFTIESYKQNLTYRVSDIRTILPDETEHLVVQEGRQLVTLITCTPIGINTHRLAVTGELIPTPETEEKARERPELPGFPWWIPLAAAAVLVAGMYVLRGERRPLPQADDAKKSQAEESPTESSIKVSDESSGSPG